MSTLLLLPYLKGANEYKGNQVLLPETRQNGALAMFNTVHTPNCTARHCLPSPNVQTQCKSHIFLYQELYNAVKIFKIFLILLVDIEDYKAGCFPTIKPT